MTITSSSEEKRKRERKERKEGRKGRREGKEVESNHQVHNVSALRLMSIGNPPPSLSHLHDLFVSY